MSTDDASAKRAQRLLHERRDCTAAALLRPGRTVGHFGPRPPFLGCSTYIMSPCVRDCIGTASHLSRIGRTQTRFACKRRSNSGRTRAQVPGPHKSLADSAAGDCEAARTKAAVYAVVARFAARVLRGCTQIRIHTNRAVLPGRPCRRLCLCPFRCNRTFYRNGGVH